MIHDKRTFASIAREGGSGNGGVPQVGWDVLQVGGRVALGQRLVMLQKRQVTCGQHSYQTTYRCWVHMYLVLNHVICFQALAIFLTSLFLD